MVQTQVEQIDVENIDTDNDTENAGDTEYDDEVPNEETIEAMRECEEMLAHPENYKWYDSVDELMQDILSEPDDDD